jgi:hypothetical protein
MTRRVYTEAHATVRFCAENLDPLDVTLALGYPPSHTHRKGEPRLGRAKSGKVVPHGPPYPHGMWYMSTDTWVDSPRLTVHVERLLEQLEPKAAVIRAFLDRGVAVDIYCYSMGATKSPPPLPRALRERARALGLEIGIDHYREDSPPPRPS